MFRHSASIKALSVALLLTASLTVQSFPLMRSRIVFDVKANLKEATPQKALSAPAAPQPTPPPNVAPPDVPQAPVIVATLTDNITAATKVAPGANINYTATITNNGAVVGTDDATNLNFSAPLVYLRLAKPAGFVPNASGFRSWIEPALSRRAGRNGVCHSSYD